MYEYKMRNVLLTFDLSAWHKSTRHPADGGCWVFHSNDIWHPHDVRHPRDIRQIFIIWLNRHLQDIHYQPDILQISIVRRMSTICHISAIQRIPIIHQINAIWRMSGGNPPCNIWRMESIGFPTLSFCIPTVHSQGNLIFLETWIPAKVELKKLSPIDLRVYGFFPFLSFRLEATSTDHSVNPFISYGNLHFAQQFCCFTRQF